MNTYNVKFTGKANIPSPLEKGHNYKLSADCTVTGVYTGDAYDGSDEITYTVRPVTISLEGDNGEVIKAADPRKNSVKIRNRLFKIYTDEGCIYPFDEVYDAYTLEINSLADTLLLGAIKRLNK